jgi:hypothetical protein
VSAGEQNGLISIGFPAKIKCKLTPDGCEPSYKMAMPPLRRKHCDEETAISFCCRDEEHIFVGCAGAYLESVLFQEHRELIRHVFRSSLFLTHATRDLEG